MQKKVISMTTRPWEAEEAAREFHLGDIVEGPTQIRVGHFNTTYLVGTDRGKYVLQLMNPRLDPAVVADQLRVFEHLSEHGHPVPRLMKNSVAHVVKTSAGNWRAYEHVEHDGDVPITADTAFVVGEQLGRFHKDMMNFPHKLEFSLPGYWDLDGYLRDMHAAYSRHEGTLEADAVKDEYQFIVDHIERVRLPGTASPRVLHGDCKPSNFLFYEGELVLHGDFDTMIVGDPLLDLGDAIRSWCRREDDTFDEELLLQIQKGYVQGYEAIYSLDTLTKAAGLKVLELAARYMTYYLEGSDYFPDTLPEQHLAKSRGYVKFYKNMMGDE